jgi:hypothetical protein
MLVAEWATAVELAMLATVAATLAVQLDTQAADTHTQAAVDTPWLAVAAVVVASTAVAAGLAVVDTAAVVVDTGNASDRSTGTAGFGQPFSFSGLLLSREAGDHLGDPSGSLRMGEGTRTGRHLL